MLLFLFNQNNLARIFVLLVVHVYGIVALFKTKTTSYNICFADISDLLREALARNETGYLILINQYRFCYHYRPNVKNRIQFPSQYHSLFVCN